MGLIPKSSPGSFSNAYYVCNEFLSPRIQARGRHCIEVTECYVIVSSDMKLVASLFPSQQNIPAQIEGLWEIRTNGGVLATPRPAHSITRIGRPKTYCGKARAAIIDRA